MQCLQCHKKLTFVLLKKPEKKPLSLPCTGCGVPILSRIGGYYSCLSCLKTNLCSSCKLCPSGHFLSRVFALNAKGASLYSQNKFSCDICHVSQTNPKKGVLHCNECEFDICEFCLGEKEVNLLNMDEFMG
jgi:hypothetical protein